MSQSEQSPRITILMENHVYPFDPRVRPHAQTLAAAGYRVVVISPNQKGRPWRETIEGVRVYRFPLAFAGKKMGGYVREYVTALFFLTLLSVWVWLRHGMDVLVYYNPPDFLFLVSAFLSLFNIKIVFDLRDPFPELFDAKFKRPNRLVSKILVGMEYCSCRAAHHVTTVNQSCKQLIVKRHKLKPEKVTVVRQGPDLNMIFPGVQDPLLRARSPMILGYMGNMAEQDGLDHLLRALHHLDQQLGYKDWYCVLIGPADDPERLRELAVRYGIAGRVELSGYLKIEQWVKMLSTVDICVEPAPASPLNRISTMNKIMDYMALGKPIVAYDLPEHHVTAGNTILYARANDEPDFALQILRLAQDAELRKQLGKLGLERVRNGLGLQHQREHLLEALNSLTGWQGKIERSPRFPEGSRKATTE